MNYKKILLFVLWVILFVISFNFALQLISEPDTILNILGVFIVVGIILVTCSTDFLTKFPKKK